MMNHHILRLAFVLALLFALIALPTHVDAKKKKKSKEDNKKASSGKKGTSKADQALADFENSDTAELVAAVDDAITQGAPAPSAAPGECPKGFEPAVGTLYDSWPKPGSKECKEYSGCRWAGMFSDLSAGGSTKSSCLPGAQFISGGSGTKQECRWPEELVAQFRMGASSENSKLFGKQVEVVMQGVKGGRSTIVNIGDHCSDSDCDGCCSRNTGNGKFELIDLEKYAAAALIGYNPKSLKEINGVRYPTAKGLRKGAPESDVMPLCYRVVGKSAIPKILKSAGGKGDTKGDTGTKGGETKGKGKGKGKAE